MHNIVLFVKSINLVLLFSIGSIYIMEELKNIFTNGNGAIIIDSLLGDKEHHILQIVFCLFFAIKTSSLLILPDNEILEITKFDFRKNKKKFNETTITSLNCLVPTKIDTNIISYILQKYIEPAFIYNKKELDSSTAIIYFDNNRVFENHTEENVQSPLNYFKVVLSTHNFEKITIISSDNKNPIINELINWNKNIEFIKTNYKETVEYLMSAKNIILGGTSLLANILILMSENAQHIFKCEFENDETVDIINTQKTLQQVFLNYTEQIISPKENIYDGIKEVYVYKVTNYITKNNWCYPYSLFQQNLLLNLSENNIVFYNIVKIPKKYSHNIGNNDVLNLTNNTFILWNSNNNVN